MNKRNITINTDYFDDGIEAKLRTYTSDDVGSLDGKRVSSRVG